MKCHRRRRPHASSLCSMVHLSKLLSNHLQDGLSRGVETIAHHVIVDDNNGVDRPESFEFV